MNSKLTKFALTAALVLAITFTLSCSSSDDNGGGGGGGGGSTSGTFKDDRDSKSYKWVKIGGQTWMAENLNYETSSSKCNNNNPANCTTFGRLYEWSTATSVCPSDWHLPSDAEWQELVNCAGGDNVAGTYLKATHDWNNGGNGTDKFGFAALPGGSFLTFVFTISTIHYDSSFVPIGEYAYWWSSTDIGEKAYNRRISYNANNVERYEAPHNNTGNNGTGNNFYSVRCVKNGGTSSSNGCGVSPLPSSGSNGGTQNSSSSSATGKLTISGFPYSYTSVSIVSAYTTNPSSIELMNKLTAAGIGTMTSNGVVDWGLANIPRTGTYTIVISRLLNKDMIYYKATGVSLTNGEGSVAWSKFNVFE